MQFYWALMLLLATAMVTIRADDVDIEGEDEVVEVEQDEEPLEVFQPPTPSGPTYFHDAILTEKDFWKRYSTIIQDMRPIQGNALFQYDPLKLIHTKLHLSESYQIVCVINLETAKATRERARNALN